MEIIVGTTPIKAPLSPCPPTGGTGTMVEGRILHRRPCRRSRGAPPPGQQERRDRRSSPDPPNGCVLLLLVSDGSKLPRDLAGGTRVFLRLVPVGNP